MISESSGEGRRFGLKAGRVEVEHIDPAALQQAVLAGGWDWIVLRLPCGQERSIEALRLLGLEPQQTDTLMTWSLDLADCRLSMPNGLTIEPARADDAEAIAALVRQVFRRYPNHYTANPLLDPALALDGYVEWALSHIEHPQRLCWVVRADDGIAALSCSQQGADGIATGVLHGVHPAHAGRGLYRGLIEASLVHFRDAGCRRFRISTQAGNLTVQNLWARLGLRIEHSRSTVHLMPLLARTLAQPAQPLPCGVEPLRALQDFAQAQSPQPALRRSLSLAPAVELASAARLRCLHWPAADAGLRQLVLLTDAEDRVLAWQHADLQAQSAP
jgi:GNAT superfamily N-acetyltransferase